AINALLKRGAEVLWEDVAFVHVSGHASQDDLEHMIELTRPRYFLPVHGEYRHLLQHARLAEKAGVPADTSSWSRTGWASSSRTRAPESSRAIPRVECSWTARGSAT